MQKSAGAGLVVAGHSKGGAMASIAAMMWNSHGVVPDHVVTLGSPNPGDCEFAEAFDIVFSQTRAQRRYEYAGDLVPYVPPARLLTLALIHIPIIGPLFRFFIDDRYAPTGEGIFISHDGSVVRESESELRFRAAITGDLVSIRRDFIAGRISEIVSAHGIGCGHGYMRGLCGDLVCGSLSPK